MADEMNEENNTRKRADRTYQIISLSTPRCTRDKVLGWIYVLFSQPLEEKTKVCSWIVFDILEFSDTAKSVYINVGVQVEIQFDLEF